MTHFMPRSNFEMDRLISGFSEEMVRQMIDQSGLPSPIKRPHRSMLSRSGVASIIERQKIERQKNSSNPFK
jgi:hypothetical protein